MEEFSLLTNQFSAEYGHSTAGQFITTTKSGTNEWHGRAWWFNYSRNRQVAAGELPVARFNSDVFTDAQRITVSDVFTLGPTKINELRLAYNRNASGFPVDLPAAPGPTDTFCPYNINDISLFIGPRESFPQGGTDNVYQMSANFSWSVGSHTFKMGADYRNIIAGSLFLPRGRGEYTYADLDEFVRDRFPSVVAIRGVGTGFFAKNRAAMFGYFQDNWQFHPRLTVDLGLRYEYTQVARNTALQDLNALSNIESIREEVVTPQLLSSLGVAPDSPLLVLGARIFDSLPQRHQSALLNYVGESFIFRKPHADRNNWAPRIGFAWDIIGTHKTSLRGGLGIAHDAIFGNLPLLQLPAQIQAENRETNACAISPSPGWCDLVCSGGDPLSSGIRHSTLGFLAGGGLLTSLPETTFTDTYVARATTGAYVRDDVAPQTYTWSVALQHELWGDYWKSISRRVDPRLADQKECGCSSAPSCGTPSTTPTLSWETAPCSTPR